MNVGPSILTNVPLWWENIDTGREGLYMGGCRHIWKIFVLCAPFRCEAKTALKNKMYFKNFVLKKACHKQKGIEELL